MLGRLAGLAKKKVASAIAAAATTTTKQAACAAARTVTAYPRGHLHPVQYRKWGLRIKTLIWRRLLLEDVDGNERRDVNTRAPLTLCPLAALVSVPLRERVYKDSSRYLVVNPSQCARAWCCSQTCSEVNGCRDVGEGGEETSSVATAHRKARWLPPCQDPLGQRHATRQLHVSPHYQSPLGRAAVNSL
ncbi:hypothetical protein BU23DRAFT_12190 [Bimuria novae-zelandiae CBS 107.79]|uniref:Uncharacterized protein n=1 Tax=Bimuria novae-zelandiae CBS 107.79 TaxID=1447943 RepID=A0A6A5VHV1_9PLEO|nr:hypothetical protein BU23DRAFT_12190 [Bimuria novae-zelandiae CBS 107.79]